MQAVETVDVLGESQSSHTVLIAKGLSTAVHFALEMKHSESKTNSKFVS